VADATARAGLVLHEIIYRFAINVVGQKNSDGTRYFNFMISTREAGEPGFNYLEVLKSAGFAATGPSDVGSCWLSSYDYPIASGPVPVCLDTVDCQKTIYSIDRGEGKTFIHYGVGMTQTPVVLDGYAIDYNPYLLSERDVDGFQPKTVLRLSFPAGMVQKFGFQNREFNIRKSVLVHPEGKIAGFSPVGELDVTVPAGEFKLSKEGWVFLYPNHNVFCLIGLRETKSFLFQGQQMRVANLYEPYFSHNSCNISFYPSGGVRSFLPGQTVEIELASQKMTLAPDDLEREKYLDDRFRYVEVDEAGEILGANIYGGANLRRQDGKCFWLEPKHGIFKGKPNLSYRIEVSQGQIKSIFPVSAYGMVIEKPCR
jgi:hypothetical protein